MSRIPLVLFLLSALTACEMSDHATQDIRGANPGQTPAPADLPPIVYADGWTDMILQANYAKTTIDQLGHFLTSRNACSKPEYGSLELPLWNIYAADLNAALATDLLKEDYCLPYPDGRGKTMDGTATITLADNKKLTLFEASRNGEVCTKIKNKEVATRLLATLHLIVQIADAEGCHLAQPPGGG